LKIADALSIRAMDKTAIEKYGIPGATLMENAGKGVARAALSMLGPDATGFRVVILCGKGNNGGDGFVAARYLRETGVEVTVLSLCEVRSLKGDAATAALAWTGSGGHVEELLSIEAVQGAASAIEEASLVIDAIFGTGLTVEPTGLHAEAIRLINRSSKKVLSIDIPSGVDATTGAVLGAAVKADVTATMAMPKLGLFLSPGRAHAGRVEVVDIGLPPEVTEDESIKWNLLAPSDIAGILRPREADSYKSSHGHLLVLAGSPGMTGAAFMCATAAMRAGAGLVTAGVPESLHAIMETKTAEVMTIGLPETVSKRLGVCSFDEIKRVSKGKSAIVIGPGAGASEELAGLISLILNEVRVPVVIDADGLNSLALKTFSLKGVKSEVVLTPHPGEMARLLGSDIRSVQADRVGAAERLADMTGATVVLKGAYTVIACPGGQIYLNPTGNPGLATAGTGDVLSGMIGAFLAQGYPASEAILAAVYIHGLAADEAVKKTGEIGMMATDLFEYIPRLVNSFAGERR